MSRAGHGEETVEKSLMDSCNDALMQMAETIGIEDFTTYQSIFGFGEKTNIDLPGEARTDALMFTGGDDETYRFGHQLFRTKF